MGIISNSALAVAEMWDFKGHMLKDDILQNVLFTTRIFKYLRKKKSQTCYQASIVGDMIQTPGSLAEIFKHYLPVLASTLG